MPIIFVLLSKYFSLANSYFFPYALTCLEYLTFSGRGNVMIFTSLKDKPEIKFSDFYNHINLYQSTYCFYYYT